MTGTLAAIRRRGDEYWLDDVPDGKNTYAQCAKPNGDDYVPYFVADGEARRVPGKCVLIVGGHRAQVVPVSR